MSFSEEAGSYFIAPAGQSGHPLSRFYENLWDCPEFCALAW
jgi:penicillin amidase